MSAPVARVSGLGIAYRAGRADVPVVRGVSFAVEPGCTLGLVGESGSGKSTVAAALLGHLRRGSRITAGTVALHGEDVFAAGPRRVRALRRGTVAMVAQNSGAVLTPSMRIGAQLAEALPEGTGDRDTRVAELLDRVRLDPALAPRYPHQLSGGQQQRVSIAMAVAARPDLLVLDEPTTGLDVLTQEEVLRLLAELAEADGLASVLVSHDLGVVRRMADEVLVLRDGEPVEQRPAPELFADPRTAYTRRLLASVPRLTDTGLAEVGEDGTRTVRDRAAGAPAGDRPVAVQVDGARITYGGTVAVEDVSFTVRRGEVLAIVGESGSGKSTLARALAGLVTPAGGTLRLCTPDGAPAGDLSRPAGRRPVEVRRALQMAFQSADTALNPRRTVGSSLARPVRLFGTATGRAGVARRVAELVADVRLDASFAGRLPAQLSGGQRQRVGIARALAGDPAVVVADEVTTALDVSVQASVLALLDDLRRERDLAVLLISHDLAVVRGLADRVLVLRHGRVVEHGPTAEVFADPQHPYTRELLTAARYTDLGSPEETPAP
ncbi:ABC transporter ATP-binding protein [Pseudonocardia sp. ICBG601]|uniref:dipeptide ABC transporter ATP-binding protein n=1 Tax=Pseudonocardia sp. ICBG601 TaxID=2846759 RepID=UPI001CF6C68B|nr:ABC transporter ATP-binding protein [Pseudonocardia sp. ICBG601]